VSSKSSKDISIINSQIGNRNKRFSEGISLQKVEQGLISNTSVFAAEKGMFFDASKSIDIQQSHISTFATLESYYVSGIGSENGSALNITNSKIDVEGDSMEGGIGVVMI